MPWHKGQIGDIVVQQSAVTPQGTLQSTIQLELHGEIALRACPASTLMLTCNLPVNVNVCTRYFLFAGSSATRWMTNGGCASHTDTRTTMHLTFYVCLYAQMYVLVCFLAYSTHRAYIDSLNEHSSHVEIAARTPFCAHIRDFLC